MGAGFQVYPEDMGSSAKKLVETGQGLAGDVESFRSETDALTSAFGDDDLGSALATIYQAASEAAFESFQDNAQRIDEIGQELQGMAEHYSKIDIANQEALHKLMGGMP